MSAQVPRVRLSVLHLDVTAVLARNVVLLLSETLGLQVCSGSTGHAEVVQVTYDKAVIAYEDLLQVRAHTVSFG